MKTRSINISIIVALLFGLAACSLKTVYNQLDVLIPYYVEGMVSLDDVLEEKLEQRTLLLVSWHRDTQLTQYADWLKRVQQAIIEQADKKTMLNLAGQINDFWLTTSARINEEMVMLLPMMSSKQKDELFASLAENNEEFEEDYVALSEAEKREAYQERMLENFETWLGSLSDQQEQIIKQVADKLNSTAELRLQRRIEWQKGLYQILSDSQNSLPVQRRLRDFMSEFEENRIRLMKPYNDANREMIIDAIIEVSATLTAQQKDHLIMQTGDYIRMFVELSENR